MIKKISGAANIPSKELEDWGIPKTVGEPKCQLRGLYISENEDGSEAGIIRSLHFPSGKW
jgi:hypothetical protein